MKKRKMIAEVIINRTAKKLNRTFEYIVPEELQDLVVIGSEVLVPFGKGEKLEEAFITNIKKQNMVDEQNLGYKLKSISKVKTNLNEEQIELAKWMAKRYFCNVSDCIKLMLTPGTKTKNNKIQDKKINVVYLEKDIQEIEFKIQNKEIKSEKQIKILKFVEKNPGVTVPEIEMLTDCSRAIVNTLVKNGYLKIEEKKMERNPLILKNEEEIKKYENSESLKLTEEQEHAFEKVEEKIKKSEYKTFLLYGVTGSR